MIPTKQKYSCTYHPEDGHMSVETRSLSLCYKTHKSKVQLLVFFFNVRRWEV